MSEFVSNWSHERAKQLEQIRGSAMALGEIIANYVEHDGTAAAGLRDSCAG